MSLAERTATPATARPTAIRGQAIRAVRSLIAAVLPPAIVAAVALGAWEAWVRWRETPEWLVPAPSAVLDRLAADPAFFASEGWVTLVEALLGLAAGTAGALALALVMSRWRPLERGLYPMAITLKVTPVVVWAPLFALWFGFGTTPKVFIAALIAFFPMLVSAVTGLRAVDPDALAFFRSVHAGPAETLWRLRLPSALPYLFAGLRVAVLLCIIGAVVAEWFGADDGIGHVIAVANNNLDTPTVFAGIITLTVIGATLNALVSIAERRLLAWHDSQRP